MTANEEIKTPIRIESSEGTAAVLPEQGLLEDRVWDALRQCYDPEIPVNIADLGLIYEVKIDNEVPDQTNVYIQMTLTAPGCSMGPMIAADVKRHVQQVPGVSNVMVDVVFEPIWNPGMMTEAAKLQLNMF